MPFYRSNTHSPLEASPNKYRTDVVSPLEASPTKYRSQMYSPLVWTPGPNLIAWYKFDEGSGTIVYNRATDGSGGGGLFPNLTVFNSYQGLFWTYNVGFGATPQLYFGAGFGADFAWAKPNRTLGGANKATIGIFLKRKADYGNKGGYASTLCQTVEGSGIGSRIFTCNPGENLGWSWEVPNAIWFAYDAALIDTWLFQFIDSDGYYRIVKSDGTILKSAITGNLTAVLQCIYAFAGIGFMFTDPPTAGYYPGGCSYGDWIIYNGIALSLSEWAQWYDQLRSRYGMSARSGW